MRLFVVDKADQALQDAADEAFAKNIWWETMKTQLPERGMDDPGRRCDLVVEAFKKRCESGFFDVKRKVK